MISITGILAALLLSNAAFAYEWEAQIRVRVLNAENKLFFGQRIDATDGYDNKYDVPAMLSGEIMAYFLIDNKSCWRDIRTANDLKYWDMYVESPRLWETIEIKWEPNLLPDHLEIKLIDLTSGIIIDMHEYDNYSYRNSGKKHISLQVLQ